MAKLKNLTNKKVTRGTKDNQTLVEKTGTELDNSAKVGKGRTVGLAIGTTLNMGDYQSLRVDVWCSDYLEEDESFEEGYARLKDQIDKELGLVVESYSED